MIAIFAAAVLWTIPFVETLPNGVRIVALPSANSEVFSVQVFIRAGSVYENTENSGGFHLLEHLLFAQGTADQVAEQNGFIVDGSTYREFMRLHASGPSEKWKAGIEAIALLLTEPRWTEIEKEKSVIAEESRLALLDPDEMVQRLLWKSSAPSNSWARPAMGGNATLIAQDLQALYRKHFVGANIVVVIAGHFPEADAISEMKSRFASLPAGQKVDSVVFGEPKIKSMLPSPSGSIGVALKSPGLDQAREWLAHEIAFDILLAPDVLEPLEVEARKYSGPSAKGSLSILVFESTSTSANIRSAVESLFPPKIDPARFATAVGRMKLSVDKSGIQSQAMLAGLSELFTGGRIDFLQLLSNLTIEDVRKAASRMESNMISWCLPR